MTSPDVIRGNLERVRENIGQAARRAGRDPGEIRLVAVTKQASPEMVAVAVREGVTDFGENRVMDGLARQRALETIADLPGGALGLRWHFIGHLQTNKAARAVRHFGLIHSIDSLRLAEAISTAALAAGRIVEALVQVNVAGEESKFGVSPEGLIGLIRDVSRLPGLAVTGLMSIAPLAVEAENVRPLFRRVAALGREVAVLRLPGVSMELLSMGMTQDYEVAITEGANLVRIGTAIFGSGGG
jgi:pyridoxal phosphate enzyme (YggS family)